MESLIIKSTVVVALVATFLTPVSSAPRRLHHIHDKALCDLPINLADPCDQAYHRNHIAADTLQRCDQKVADQRQQCISFNRGLERVDDSTAANHVRTEIEETQVQLQLLLADRYNRLNDATRTDIPDASNTPSDVIVYCASETGTRFIIPSQLPIPQRNSHNDLRMEVIQACFTTLLNRNPHQADDQPDDVSYVGNVTDYVKSHMRSLSCAMKQLNAHHHAGGNQCTNILDTAAVIPRTERRWNGNQNSATFTLEIVQLLNSYTTFLNIATSYLQTS